MHVDSDASTFPLTDGGGMSLLIYLFNCFIYIFVLSLFWVFLFLFLLLLNKFFENVGFFFENEQVKHQKSAKRNAKTLLDENLIE